MRELFELCEKLWPLLRSCQVGHIEDPEPCAVSCIGWHYLGFSPRHEGVTVLGFSQYRAAENDYFVVPGIARGHRVYRDPGAQGLDANALPLQHTRHISDGRTDAPAVQAYLQGWLNELVG